MGANTMTTTTPSNVLQRPKNLESPGVRVEPSIRERTVPVGDQRDPALVEKPVVGPILFVVLVLLGGVAGGVLTGSPGAGLAFAGMIGGMAAILVASL